jgi:hypothetical protein
MADKIYCNMMFCPLEKECARKGYLGKPYDPNLKHESFADSLTFDRVTGEWSCEDGITKEL